MNTTFIARKITLSDSFKQKAEQRLKKLDRFFDDPRVQILVSAQKDTATVELTLWADGMIYRAEKQDRDKMDALDDAVDTLIRRIRKNKTKLQKKVKSSAFEVASDLDSYPEEDSFDVIRTKEVELRPMTADEAILQMNLLGHTFFVYRDAETGETNVVYRRSEDGYGIIIPK